MYIVWRGSLQCTRAESLHSFLPTFRTFAERETILSEQNGKVNVFKKNNIKKNLKKLKLKFEVTN